MAREDDDFGPLARRVGLRVRRFREARGLSLRSFAAELGLAPSVLSKVENGQQGENLRQLDELATRLGVDPLDFFVTPDEPIVSDTRRLRHLLVDATRRLSAHQLSGLLRIAESFAPFDEVPAPEVGAIPLLDLQVAAGTVDLRNLGPGTRWVRPHTTRAIDDTMVVVRVVGDSMEPAIRSGDHLLCTRTVRRDPRGRVIVARFGADAAVSGFVVKRFRGERARRAGEGDWREVRLTSENPRHPDLVLTGRALSEVEIVAECLEVLGRGSPDEGHGGA
jgi:transcriptional regulator with XRE-family HTH domain